MWSSVLKLLPFEVGNAIRLITNEVSEIRIRRGAAVCVTVVESIAGEIRFTNRALGIFVSDEMMTNLVRTLTGHSLYTHEDTLKEGYITVQGCYRVGVCGEVVCDGNTILNMKRIDSVVIRLWKERYGIADPLYGFLQKKKFTASLLLYSLPGMGKTTVLRDLGYSLSQREPHLRVSVIDSRYEIITPALRGLNHLDVLSGYPKVKGMEIATRVLSPQYILCDEIGPDEAGAMEAVLNSGVPIIATAHGSSIERLLHEAHFFSMHQRHCFDAYVKIVSLTENAAKYEIVSREEVGAS